MISPSISINSSDASVHTTSEIAPAANAVLVLDDDATLNSQLASAAEALGYRAFPASSTAEAEGILAQHPEIAAVISDIRMPVEDGLTFAKRVLQARPDNEAVGFIMITGHLSVEGVTAALRAGAADFLQKPFRLAELSDSLDRATNDARRRRAIAEERASLRAAITSSLEARGALAERLKNTAGEFGLATCNGCLTAEEQLAVSHALRTPLNALSGAIDLLVGEADSASHEVLVPIMQRGLLDAVDTVEHLEELQRICREDVPEAATEVDLGQLAADIAGAMRHQHAEDPSRNEPPRLHVRVAPRAIRRALQLACEALKQWRDDCRSIDVLASPPSCIRNGWDYVTLCCSRGDTTFQLPDGPAFPAQGTPHSRTLESLRFILARRLIQKQGGQLSSWTAGHDAAALRIAFPARDERT